MAQSKGQLEPASTDLAALREAFVGEVRKRIIGPFEADEVITEPPHKRYLTGMVFPRGASAGKALAEESELQGDSATEGEEDHTEFESPLDMLFQKLPASVGLTFALAEGETRIRVKVAASSYRPAEADILADDGEGAARGRRAGRSSRNGCWKRVSLVPGDAEEEIAFSVKGEGREKLAVLGGRASLHLHVRKAQGVPIATVSLVNERSTDGDAPVNVEDILFQVRMQCFPNKGVQAYPDPPSICDDPEAEELALQYRGMPTFAVGHGCAVAWPDASDGTVAFVGTDFLPAVEVPPVTTDIDSLPESVQECLSLRRLQDHAYDPFGALSELVEEYRTWRNRLAGMELLSRFENPRQRVLLRIDAVLERMGDGIQLLRTNATALKIFRLANRAMLLSLARTDASRRRNPGEAFVDVDLASVTPHAFRWRPFQLAFMLLSLRGLWEPTHADRSIVDLIWFPTGGGKTEAYLAVAAFEMLRRRIVNGDRGAGTAVIKRYTLRLLTIQQFERAGSLVCALESLRQAGQIPGIAPFSLGLWVGKDSAPNDFKAARADLSTIINAIGKVEGVKVPLKHCPVCGTPIIPAQKLEGKDGVGIRDTGGSVELFCPNKGCKFSNNLPISYIDDFLYEHPPTMLLGTIDKFAMLAWREEARAFFGTDTGMLPPSLIIQDELHLISGPLGTVAGVYEAAIDTAITSLGHPPKYICATATIRRADDQIRKLYGRKAALFPPPGLDAADSFFSKAAFETPGRLYLGTLGQGHTPTFSNVITSSALLAAGQEMRGQIGDRADTWWTLVAYHNSKRELGKTLSLAKDDIPARLKALGEKRTVSGSAVLELSANRKDSEIPEALHLLAKELPDVGALDFVACTNMLSVGVDVQRLGLMLVNGQPKTVSEYIQASSRVGRSSSRPPGIVLALFSPTKPRDRSHFEFFRSFHKGYYRHVEPTSVTPFALPSLDRGLHGAFLALVRMVSSVFRNNHASMIASRGPEVRGLADKLLQRIQQTGDGSLEETRARLDEFLTGWKNLASQRGANLRFQSQGAQHAALIKPFRAQGNGWETLQSLRHVDTPLRLEVPLINVQEPVVVS